ncbi:hypothetical protein HRbin29_00420 [bacterium HR29]|jgi:CBS domain-containing protein|nr:hypothetical protein HRbin29_00420 [bacterium HR29]
MADTEPVKAGNLVACPLCGEWNIEGADHCENCLADLAALDVPVTAQPGAETEFNTPLTSLRVLRPVVVAPETPVRDVVARLRDEPDTAAVVMRGSTVVGIFTERDVLKRIVGRPERLDDPVERWMTPDPVILRDSDTIAVGLHKMAVGGFRHLPLVHGDELVGVVSGSDLLIWFLIHYFEGVPAGS